MSSDAEMLGYCLNIMGSATTASNSINDSRKTSNNDEIFMQHSLQFANGLKDLKNLRKQLYSAAEYFESSFDKEDHKQFLVETSKDYVAKALVNTVDHLGSVADKLNKFLDEKANEFSNTSIRFSCIQQRLNTFQGFINLRSISKQSMMMVEAPKHHKKYIIPENFEVGKSKFLYRNCISCPQYDMHQSKQENSFAKAFQAATIKQHPPLLRKGHSRITSCEISPSPLIFSFTKVSNKETGKHSVSPLHFPLKRLGSVANRSVSPSPSENKQRCPSEPRRAISVSRRPEMRDRETDILSYSKKSKHMFKAFLNIPRPRKEL